MPAGEMTGSDAITPVTAQGQSQSQSSHANIARFFADAENADTAGSFTVEEEKLVLRRIDRRVLLLLLGAYFFQQLDKSSLSYVSIFGLVEDAHLVGQQYSWLGSILYISQLVMQPLAAFVLVKAPTGKVIATAVFFWGTTLTLMALCKDFKSLLGMRYALGSFESMIGMPSEIDSYMGGFRTD
jgi:hypothetical protein